MWCNDDYLYIRLYSTYRLSVSSLWYARRGEITRVYVYVYTQVAV